MTDTTYVEQFRKTISGEFYFGTMCRETRRRIAISTDASKGKLRYSRSGETIVSCHHCGKIHRRDNRDIFSFQQGRVGMTISIIPAVHGASLPVHGGRRTLVTVFRYNIFP